MNRVLLWVLLMLIPAYGILGCEKKKPKRSPKELAAIMQKYSDEDNAEAFALLAAKYITTAQDIKSIINTYSSKHSIQADKPDTDQTSIDATLSQLSKAHNLSKKSIAEILLDFKVISK